MSLQLENKFSRLQTTFSLSSATDLPLNPFQNLPFLLAPIQKHSKSGIFVWDTWQPNPMFFSFFPWPKMWAWPFLVELTPKFHAPWAIRSRLRPLFVLHTRLHGSSFDISRKYRTFFQAVLPVWWQIQFCQNMYSTRSKIRKSRFLRKQSFPSKILWCELLISAQKSSPPLTFFVVSDLPDTFFEFLFFSMR